MTSWPGSAVSIMKTLLGEPAGKGSRDLRGFLKESSCCSVSMEGASDGTDCVFFRFELVEGRLNMGWWNMFRPKAVQWLRISGLGSSCE